MSSLIFRNGSSDSVTIEDIVRQIKKFLEEDETSQYSLTIGTDSEARTFKNEGEQLVLISAIVIYRKGYGGKYFWMKRKTKNAKSLRDKIYQEVLQSVEVAKELVPELKTQINGKSKLYDLEIHIDVGETGKTREMIQEVVGMVTGFGFTAKTKPYSYAASNIADKLI